MKIIRDDELGGLGMIPLFVQWGIKRCNVEGCTEVPNTIVRYSALREILSGIASAGFCEEHFQRGNTEEGVKYNLIFDDFDAFEARRLATEMGEERQ